MSNWIKNGEDLLFTQTDRFALSSLRKQGSRNVTDVVDSRFRGNDKSCYVVVIEQLTILFGSKSVSLSYLLLMNYYWLFLCGLLCLCGSNNRVNQCKSVSNRRLFEKTKPISKKQSWRKYIYGKVLWRNDRGLAAKKQTQFKANMPAFGRKSEAWSPESETTASNRTQFEKTKPMSK